VSHASFVVRPLVLTSPPPQPSSVADVTPQDTQDSSVASPLSHTKPRAQALTRKTYIANPNNICLKPPQEDISDGSVSGTQRSYHANHASCPPFHRRIAQTKSTLS
jgi:hypothetical protein